MSRQFKTVSRASMEARKWNQPGTRKSVIIPITVNLQELPLQQRSGLGTGNLHRPDGPAQVLISEHLVKPTAVSFTSYWLHGLRRRA